MLFVFDTNDRIVPAMQMADRLREHLTESAERDVRIVVIPDASHAMVNWTGFPRFVPGFLDTVSGWLLEHVQVAG